jgi:hypothetical protein
MDRTPPELYLFGDSGARETSASSRAAVGERIKELGEAGVKASKDLRKGTKKALRDLKKGARTFK